MSLFDAISKPENNVVKNSFYLSEHIHSKLVSKKPYPSIVDTLEVRTSSLPRFCAREECLLHDKKISRENIIGYELQKIFDLGHGVHSIIQNSWLKDRLWGKWNHKTGTSIYDHASNLSNLDDYSYEEMSYDDFFHGIKVTGHSDGFISNDDGTIDLLEIKSCSTESFKNITEFKRRPLDDHLFQVNFYYYLTKRKKDVIIPPLNKIRILYIEKSQGLIKEFILDYEEFLAQKAVQRLSFVESYIKHLVVPEEKICSTNTCSRAKSCLVRKQCFGKG